MTKKDPNTVVDDIAASIEQLIGDLERREKSGETLKATEVRRIANQLHSHVTDLLAAVGRLRQKKSDD